MHNVREFLKARIIAYCLIILFCVGYISYFLGATSNIIYQDFLERFFMNLLGKYYQGDLTFSDLWAPYNGARNFGPALMFLGNAVFFKINTRVDMYVGAIFLLLTALMLFEYYRKPLGDFGAGKFIEVYYAAPLMVLFSLNQWENICFTGGTVHIVALLPFLITFLILDRMARENKVLAFLPWYAAMAFLSAFVFGSLYSLGFLFSMIVFILFKTAVIDRKIDASNGRILLAVLAVCFACIFLYMQGMTHSQTITQGLANVLGHPVESVKFFLFTLSGSVFGLDYFTNHMNAGAALVVGIVLLLIYVYSAFIYLSSKMASKTLLPVILACYSFITMALITLARISYLIDRGMNTYGMSSRYTTNTMLGLIAILFIVVYDYLGNKDKVHFSKKILFPLIVIFILFGQIATSVEEWQIAHFRKAYYEKMREMAYFSEEYTPDELKAKFQVSDASLVVDGLKFLKAHNLNVFSDFRLGRAGGDLESAVLLKGWYDETDKYRWISKSAVAAMESGSEGTFLLVGSVNPVVFDKAYGNFLRLSVYGNNTLLGARDFTADNIGNGEFEMKGSVPPNTALMMKLSLDKSFVPSQMGLGDDGRELGIVVRRLEMK